SVGTALRAVNDVAKTAPHEKSGKDGSESRPYRASLPRAGEAGALEGTRHVLVAHERLPHEAGAQVLRHEQRDTRVDADDVGVVPAGHRVERVDEAVAAPGTVVVRADRAQYAQGLLRQERQRPGRRAG